MTKPVLPRWLPLEPWTGEFWLEAPWHLKLYWAITIAFVPFALAEWIGLSNVVGSVGKGWLIGCAVGMVPTACWWHFWERRKILRRAGWAPLVHLEDTMLNATVKAIVVITVENTGNDIVATTRGYALSKPGLIAVLEEAARKTKSEL